MPDVLESSVLQRGGTAWLRAVEKPLLAVADFFALLLAAMAWRPHLARDVGGLDVDSLLVLNALPDRLLLFLLVVCVAVATFWYRGHYSRRMPFWHETRQVFKFCLLVALLDVTALFFADLASSRSQLLLAWLTAPLLIIAFRVLLKRVYFRLGGWLRPALIIGTGGNALDCARAIERESMLGLRVAAFIAIGDEPAPPRYVEHNARQYPVLALQEALNWLAEDKVFFPQVFMALEAGQLQAKAGLVGKVSRLTQHMYVVPAFRGLPLVGLEASHFFGQDMAVLWVPNNLGRSGPQFIKRLFDVVVSAGLLLLLSPLLLCLAWRISRDGPVLFGHPRIGRKGKSFACLKFRTMVPDADRVLEDMLSSSAVIRSEWERDFKLRQDPRVTRFGAMLRRTSLDELPQLWNVLKGDMSLVGPRPIVEKELDRYGEYAPYYLECRPGITGMWQISGRNDVDYQARVQLDAWYARNWSLWYDVVILLRTISVVCNRRGAY